MSLNDAGNDLAEMALRAVLEFEMYDAKGFLLEMYPNERRDLVVALMQLNDLIDSLPKS